MEEPFSIELVRGVLHGPDSPNGHAIALTHGAGSNCNAPLLVKLAHAFSDAGYIVLRYDLPFRQAGTTPHPSRAGKDREGVARAVDALRGMAKGNVIAAGHSYGGRQSAMAASEKQGMADALLLLSYPLHPPAKPDQKRTDYFPNLKTPALFVHGTKDPFGAPEELREAIDLIPAHTDLLLVEGAAHDLKRAAGLSGDILTRLHALLCYPEN